ncbi:phosphate transport system permease protein [Halobacteriovorax marinus SJ]|uniref:Phosphate transport system permease protein PstA n=1 Tax=Halobacteriovorax marinus (strain ATCC BAA-682 / DSM 15412 / SJ) TaxID=862908 RepID=E1X4V6_HALMS|nr:phosphate ABC transporter permease PstA [Halobacteriovorax marinus]CBW27182.1 phosphate transport system permease protein [Halobacteriovorax marinus SJ]
MNYFQYRKLKNIVFHSCLVLAAIIVLLPLFLIVSYVFKMGATSLNLDFFFSLPKPVGEIGGGMKHAIIGTLYLVAIGSLISIPIGLFCGIYLSEFGKGKVATLLRFSIDMLTGVPSIIIGIFAYILIVVPLKGFSAIAGGVALSIIILPIVCRSTEEILKLVPQHIREAGLALGLPRWRVILNIVVKGNLSSLITGVMLAISRAAGETAPLLFTAFGNMYLSYRVDEPMASLPVQIYNYAISPFDDWRRQAWAGAFVLIALVLGINLLARVLVKAPKLKNLLQKRSS